METSEKAKTQEIRAPKGPEDLHQRIEKYISLVHVNEGRVLLKPDAIIELLYAATKDITLP